MVIFSKINSSLFLAVLLLLMGACSKSDDQRQFENRALVPPQNITEMTARGEVVPDKEDPDDWDIAPMFAGLVKVETPAHPNPVSLNSTLRIDLYIRGLETIDAIEVYAFEFPYNIYPITIKENLSSTTLVTINLNAEMIAASSAGSASAGLYRILIYDGRQNLITYGDIRLQ